MYWIPFVKGERARMCGEAKLRHPDARGIPQLTRIRMERIAYSAWKRGELAVLPPTYVNTCGGIEIVRRKSC